MLPIVAATADWVIVMAAASLLVSVLLSQVLKTLYMLWLGAYPCCPDVLHSWTAMRRCLYAPRMNFFSSGHVLIMVASQSSNSFMGKMPDWKRRWMAFAMSFSCMYGLCMMSAIF